jgi:ATP-dependent protease ClpP protease subunit
LNKNRLNGPNDDANCRNQEDTYVKILETPYTARHYKVFLNKEIGEPHLYEELIQILLTSSETDFIEISCNSTGGQLDSCIDIFNALQASESRTKAIISGNAHSAMSIIALACDDCIAMPHSAMLVHQPRGGNYGRHAEQVSYGEFSKKHIETFFKDAYSGFLETPEIYECLNGKDYWFDSEEINRRIANRNKIREKELKKIKNSKS